MKQKPELDYESSQTKKRGQKLFRERKQCATYPYPNLHAFLLSTPHRTERGRDGCLCGVPCLLHNHLDAGSGIPGMCKDKQAKAKASFAR